MASPVARAWPILRARLQVPPQSGMRPMLMKLWMNRADRFATTRVAGQGEVGAGTGGDAVDGAHHRLVQAPDGPGDRVVALAQGLAQVGPGFPRGAPALVQVLAGAESAAGPGDQHGPHRGVRGQAGQHGHQFLAHGGVDAVEAVGPVEGQDGQRLFLLQLDGIEGHGGLSLRVRAAAGVPRAVLSLQGKHGGRGGNFPLVMRL